MLRNILALFAIAALSCLSIYCSAQVKNSLYTGQWKNVDSLVNKGLVKSALAEVEKIYASAKRNGNDIQVIKSLLYKLSLNENIQEEAAVKNVVLVDKEIAEAKQPAKSILLSISAEMYWHFFQQNRYRIYGRTKTENFSKPDIQTWSADDFHKKIAGLYLSSIKEEKLLQQTKLDQFDPILIKGNVRYLRPTLYDLLANEALQYFKSDERDITRPSYAFEIKDEQAFAPAAQFASYKFTNRDSSSLHYKALVVFQKLLTFHQPDTRPDALIDADINRIEFVRQYGVMSNKDELYIKALQNLAAAFPGSTASAQADFLVAQEVFNKANAGKNKPDSALQYTLIQAKELAEATVKKFPASEGGINAKNLITTILHKNVGLTCEKVNISGKPFRMLVNYKNVSAINARIIEITPDLKALLERNDSYDAEQPWKKLNAQKFIRSWQQQLPVVNDYRDHSVEIKIDALPRGKYALLSSVSPDFSLNKNPLAVQYFYVSDISFVNNGREYFILNRETGKPLPGANVQVWSQYYDYKLSRNTLQKQEHLTTDKNGYFVLPQKKDKKGKVQNEERNIRLEITFGNDRLFLDDDQYSYGYYNGQEEDGKDYDKDDVNDYEKEKARIFLFTDRSIYRPGQLVYFKGIAVTKDIRTHRSKLLLSRDSLKVMLTDPNDQKIDSIKLSVNEFGSINGKFRLPENKMNGEFGISVKDFDDASVSFSVEEYKRPKFYAELEKVKGTYRVNDTVKVTGFAKAYAGNNVDGATVKYRVTRIARFLYPWMFWRWPMPQTQPLEITHGEIQTGADGKFHISFEAIPDLSIDKKTDPVFDYKVEADVTDINGETRSASATIPVGYKALDLQLTLPQRGAINVDSLKQIFVSSKNLAGAFEPTKADVKIYKLQVPQRLIRARYWERPDQFIMSREEFLQYFPNDEYVDESKKETWLKGEVVFTGTDSTTRSGNWELANSNFRQGWYVAEATAKDKDGQEVKDVKYFELYDLKTTSLPAPAYSWSAEIKNTAEPGEKAGFISGSSANDLFVIQQIDGPSSTASLPDGDRQTRKPGSSSDRPGLTGNYEYYTVSNEKKTFEFTIDEQERGGFGIYQFFVKDNRLYTTTFNINVPWTNKQLDISYGTFRNKTLPGSEEKWKVRISGSKGEKVAAEMLAGMYDASLDQFKPHSWTTPNIWPVFSGYNRWTGIPDFTAVQSMEKWLAEEYEQQKEKRYDVLIYNNTLVSPLRIRGMSSLYGSKAASPEILENATLSGVEVKALSGKAMGVQIVTAQGQKDEGIVAPPVEDKGIQISELRQKINILDQSQIQIRKNFNETAFFFPELKTDKDGNVEFSFSMPEALTQWKVMTLAHTKDLSLGYSERTVVTQKQLMVQPNVPRFVREGDTMEFSAKIVNLDTTLVSGQAQLQLYNASTMENVDESFENNLPERNFVAAAGQSTTVNFKIIIPANYNDALVYRIVAKTSFFPGEGRGGASDGEEAAIPVLTNRTLVTETMPLPVRGTQSKNFTFDKLLHSGNSSTLSNHALTVEFTSNPAWYAVQALPYLMEFPYECAEQTFNRYYANSIAAKIVSASPKIKAVFEKWKVSDTSALLSNLQKNEELKSVLLEETPWVLQAKNESLQKKNTALLFDMVRMSSQLESTLASLKDMQSPNGGFVWFKGGPDDRYITQYILTGIGHLRKLNVLSKEQDQKLLPIINAAIPYLERKIKEDYANLKKYKAGIKNNNLSAIAIQYLYMRSFFPQYPIAKENETAYNYYLDQSQKYWLAQSKFAQAMIALSLYRQGDEANAKAIVRSLKENAVNNEDLGMYWKEFDEHGYWWYQAPIESQAVMIEAFGEIDKDPKVVDDLKTWLLKNKQTNNWRTTKATADACYALLLQGTDPGAIDPMAIGWLSEEKNVTVKLGNTVIDSKDEKQEAGTGYFKHEINGDGVTPGMGNINVTVSAATDASKVSRPANTLAWGAVYWQYFENLDKITFSETPLKLSKKLFIEKNTDRGPVLFPLSPGEAPGEVKTGDKIKVRIELRADRDMEYVHMKDMRAACMEPTNVISQYKYQDGLGYYETTKDASTNFFFSYLPKGTYVFEYSLFVTNTGNFSNGITTIQCMYAPEFTAHSEGIRMKVAE